MGMIDTKSAAVLTIHAAGTMTPKGRRQISDWLRKQADMLVERRRDYTHGRYTARYLYPVMRPKA